MQITYFFISHFAGTAFYKIDRETLNETAIGDANGGPGYAAYINIYDCYVTSA